MNPEPVVSVLMPVWNGEKYLDEAMQSILGQTFENLELIAIDDGSTDNTRSILEGYAQRDIRVKVFTQENRGLVSTLNRGLNLARGTYLARMDADDISTPDRLEKQVAFLQRKKDVVLLGSILWMMSENGYPPYIGYPPLHDTSIRWHLLFDNPFTHSTVMFRMETVRRYSLEYRQEAVLAEDYDMWSRLLDFGKGQNLETPLLTRRFHDQQITDNDEARFVSARSATRIARANLAKLGFCLEENKVSTLRVWSHQFPRILNIGDEHLCMVLLDILETYCQQPNLSHEQLQLIRGRTALRLLLARSNQPGGENWKIRVIRRLQLADFLCIVKYLRYRQKLIGWFPSIRVKNIRICRR